MDERKRKCYFGSAEKERKYYKENSFKGGQEGERRNKFDVDDDTTAVFSPKSSSSAQKKPANQGNRQFRDMPKSRRRIPLEDVQNKKGTKNFKKAVVVPVETDERKLATRQRQIDIGKNTEGYRRYVQDVARLDRTSDHPWTPNKFTVCSTRSWQGVMRIWRRKLHYWDPPELRGAPKETFFDSSANTIETKCISPRKKCFDNSMDIDDCPSSGSSQSSTSDEHKTNIDWGNSNEDDFLFSHTSIEENHLFKELADYM